MNRKLALVVVLLLAAACRRQEPAAPATTESSPSSSGAPTAAATPTATAPTATTPAPAGGTDPIGVSPPSPATASLASQETNWQGIAADVTEFKRKGNALTAKVVLRNHGSGEPEADVHYGEVYVMDLAGGKKYEVLKDEKGSYIAALRSGWNDRWYQKLGPGETFTLWMKFPAPPPDVKSVTLQIPGMPPFEDLTIQDI